MLQQSEYLNKISRLKLREFSSVDLASLMRVNDVFLSTGYYTTEMLAEIEASLPGECEYSTSAYRFTDAGSDVLALFSQDYIRDDHRGTFLKLIGAVGHLDCLCAERIARTRCSLREILRNRNFMRSCDRALGALGLSNAERLTTLQQLLRLRKSLPVFDRLDMTKYRMLVVFFDASMSDAYLVSRFRQKGIATATLHHGAASTLPREPKTTIADYAIEYSMSTADRFLTWSGFSRDRAIAAGVPAERVRVLGIPKFAGVTPLKPHAEKGCFGVVLGTLLFDEENRALIRSAKAVAFEKGLRFVLKYHPQMAGNEYDELVSGEPYDGAVVRGTSIEDYARSVDFTLVGGSSMFVELVFLGHRTYHLRSGADDIYLGVSYHTYTNDNELLGLLSRSAQQDAKDEEYLVGPRDILERYREFFGK